MAIHKHNHHTADPYEGKPEGVRVRRATDILWNTLMEYVPDGRPREAALDAVSELAVAYKGRRERERAHGRLLAWNLARIFDRAEELGRRVRAAEKRAEEAEKRARRIEIEAGFDEPTEAEMKAAVLERVDGAYVYASPCEDPLEFASPREARRFARRHYREIYGHWDF